MTKGTPRRNKREKMINPEISNSERERKINEYVHSERDRAIMIRRFIDGANHEAIAEEFGLSPRQVKNIIYQNEAFLKAI